MATVQPETIVETLIESARFNATTAYARQSLGYARQAVAVDEPVVACRWALYSLKESVGQEHGAYLDACELARTAGIQFF